jgi:hypothetical protein
MHILSVLFAVLFSFGQPAATPPADAFVAPSEYATDYGTAIPSHDQIVSGAFDSYAQGDAPAAR